MYEDMARFETIQVRTRTGRLVHMAFKNFSVTFCGIRATWLVKGEVPEPNKCAHCFGKGVMKGRRP